MSAPLNTNNLNSAGTHAQCNTSGSAPLMQFSQVSMRPGAQTSYTPSGPLHYANAPQRVAQVAQPIVNNTQPLPPSDR